MSTFSNNKDLINRQIHFAEQLDDYIKSNKDSFIAGYFIRQDDKYGSTSFTSNGQFDDPQGDLNYCHYYSPRGTMGILSNLPEGVTITINDKAINQLIYVIKTVGPYVEIDAIKDAFAVDMTANKVPFDTHVPITILADNNLTYEVISDFVINDETVVMIYEGKKEHRNRIIKLHKNFFGQMKEYEKYLMVYLYHNGGTSFMCSFESSKETVDRLYPFDVPNYSHDIKELVEFTDQFKQVCNTLNDMLINIYLDEEALHTNFYNFVRSNGFTISKAEERTIQYKGQDIYTATPDYIINGKVLVDIYLNEDKKQFSKDNSLAVEAIMYENLYPGCRALKLHFMVKSHRQTGDSLVLEMFDLC